MTCRVTIRSGDQNDLLFLRELLFEAGYWRTDQERPSLEKGLARLDLVYLLEGWGREWDTTVIATLESGERVGAAWYRFWNEAQHSYGYLSPEIPEIAIAVRSSYRGRGVGKQLLVSLLVIAARQGIAAVSLSVELDNAALRLYKKCGFVPAKKVENSWTMAAATGGIMPSWLEKSAHLFHTREVQVFQERGLGVLDDNKAADQPGNTAGREARNG